MHTDHRTIQIRKILIGVIFTGIFLTTLSSGSVSSVHAQDTSYFATSNNLYMWSPVANVVLFWSLNTENGGPGLMPYDLNLYNAETDEHNILASDGYGGTAKFSMNGSTISFWYDNTPYIVVLDNDVISIVMVETDNVPVKGAFSSNNDLFIYTTESDEIRVRDLTTDLETSLGSSKNISTLPYLFPEWSPNDQWVAFGTETNVLLIDPSGMEDSIILSASTFPQSEFSPAIHYFAWSSDGSTLYGYDGTLVHTFTSESQSISIAISENQSFDGSYEILYSDGELFLQNVKSGIKEQLTFNNSIVEQMLDLEIQSQSNDDISAQATADGFDFPVGKPDGAGYNTTAGCWWLQTTGACAPGPHPGQDFNGNGGGDSDLGNPVYAVANGTVVFSGVGSGTSWGNIIMIEHTLPDGSKVWSQYAHLQNRYVNSGTVNKGDQIGTIGKGYNNIYSAHLHFEIRKQYRTADAWITGWSVSQVEQYYVNPTDYINSHRTIGGGTNNCQNTGGTGIRLYDGTNCTGTEKYFPSAGFTNMPDIGFNDAASSINVGDGWSVKVYENDNRGGSSRCITGDMWDLAQDKYTSGDTNRIINNDISSIEVFSNSSCSGGTPTPDHSVQFYKNPNYGDGYCYADSASNYTNIDGCSGYNDQISSVLLKPGWSVRVYEHANLAGGWKCYTSSDPDFSNDTFDNGVNVNDKLSSFSLYNQSPCPPIIPDPPCYLLTRNYSGSGSAPTASPPNSTGCSSGYYHSAETITLTSHPSAGYHLDQWTGTNSSSSNILTMPSSNRTVTAYYAQNSTDDNYEENDTIGTAYDLSTREQQWLNTINGYGIQADNDWYRIEVTPDFNRVLIDARFTHSQGDIDIALYNSSGTLLAHSISATDNEFIDYTVPSAGGYYYILAYYANRGNQYNLWWDDVPPPVRGGPDTTGVFRPSNGLLYLKNANTTGFADIAINYGLGGDYPVVGDWDGDGDATIGIYRNGLFYLRNSNTIGFADMVFAFGTPGDQPIAGDWNGDGIDTIGVYRPYTGQFLLRNSNSAGSPQMSFYLGNVGDVGIAGDWNGDGIDTTGVFRPSNGALYLKNTNATGFADIQINYGLPGDKPVTGDWNNDGVDTIGVYRNGQFMLRNSNTIGFADIVFALGVPGDMPIAGDWDGMP